MYISFFIYYFFRCLEPGVHQFLLFDTWYVLLEVTSYSECSIMGSRRNSDVYRQFVNRDICRYSLVFVYSHQHPSISINMYQHHQHPSRYRPPDGVHLICQGRVESDMDKTGVPLTRVRCCFCCCCTLRVPCMRSDDVCFIVAADVKMFSSFDLLLCVNHAYIHRDYVSTKAVA